MAEGLFESLAELTEIHQSVLVFINALHEVIKLLVTEHLFLADFGEQNLELVLVDGAALVLVVAVEEHFERVRQLLLSGVTAVMTVHDRLDFDLESARERHHALLHGLHLELLDLVLLRLVVLVGHLVDKVYEE